MHLSLNNSLGKWILPTTAPFSPEATNYFSRLDAAGDTTYVDYKQPLANYIDSLVTLGGAYWDDMLSATSFVGVGIEGITVPLRDGMTVPTNNNFVAGDLDQLTGLSSDGATKSLDLNKNATDLSLDDHALSFHLTNGRTTTAGRYMGGALSNLEVLGNSTGFRARSFTNTIGVHGTSVSETGLIGISRNNSADYDWMYETTGTAVIPSAVITASPLYMFRAATTSFPAFRAATYTVGPALDLATLEGLQATLLSEIRTAHTFVAAASYFARLAAAGDTAHVAYKQPLTNYITSLVELGGAYWDDMLSSTSFVGVGIEGITVPLKDGMPAITNNNFVAGDLSQLTGLKGGSTKELATGILDNQLTDSNASASVYATEAATTGAHLSNDFNNGAVNLRVGSPTFVSLRGLATNTSIVTAGVTGLIGLTRSTDTNLDGRASQTNVTEANAGTLPRNNEIFVLSRNAAQFADSRLATYHIGESLDLATLEGLQDTLITEIAAASPFSAEAQNYFSRLDTAGDTTYTAYKQPLANYIDSLVALGGAYWDTMESAASFVGVGIQGITVPLKSTMPTLTNNNFVAGDLNQLTGLLGDGSTKYLATGLTGTDLSQDDHSFSFYASSAASSGFAGGTYSTNFTRPVAIAVDSTTTNFYSTGPLDASSKVTSAPTLVGLSRSASTEYTARTNQGDETVTRTSGTPNTGGLSLFAVGAGVAPTASRLATYHAGPALNLATLEGLQATLITEIAAI